MIPHRHWWHRITRDANPRLLFFIMKNRSTCWQPSPYRPFTPDNHRQRREKEKHQRELARKRAQREAKRVRRQTELARAEQRARLEDLERRKKEERLLRAKTPELSQGELKRRDMLRRKQVCVSMVYFSCLDRGLF